MLEGSGKSSETKETDGSSFRQISKFLAKQGIASLRFNKRGSGYNRKRGLYFKTSLEDNYKDAKNALLFLKSHKSVDSKNIFVMGQSMGGTRAVKLTLDFDWIKGIMLVASPTRPFSEFNNEQLEYLYTFKGMPKKKIKEEIDKNTDWINSVSKDSYDCEKDSKCESKDGVNTVDGQSLDYWRQSIKHNQVELLFKVKIPVLVIQGTSDWVVSVKDAALAATTLEKIQHPDYQVNIISGFDHFFVNNHSKNESIKYMIGIKTKKKKPKPLHDEFKSVLGNWLKKHL